MYIHKYVRLCLGVNASHYEELRPVSGSLWYFVLVVFVVHVYKYAYLYTLTSESHTESTFDCYLPAIACSVAVNYHGSIHQ